MPDEVVHCNFCNADVPRPDFLKHFRECSAKNRPPGETVQPAAPKPQPPRAAPAPAVAGSEPEESPDVAEDDLAAAMGMDAGDIGGAGGGGNGFRGVYDDEPDYGPTMPGPGATRKKKKKPIDPSQLDWQGQRKYKHMQAKMAWKQKHMRDQPITETGLQFLEMDEEDRFDMEACRFCRFYFYPEDVKDHERRCVQRTNEEPTEEDAFDLAAPVAALQDHQRKALRRRGILESHEYSPRGRSQSPQRVRVVVPPDLPQGGRRGKLYRAQHTLVAPAEDPESALGPTAYAATPALPLATILDRLPDNPNWLETIPRTLEVLQDVAMLMDDVRRPRPSPLTLEGEPRVPRRRPHREAPPRPPLDEKALVLEAAQRRAALEVAREAIEPPLAPLARSPVPSGRDAESAELLAMEARRRAVLQGIAFDDAYYPYSDKFMLPENAYDQARQRQWVIDGMRGAVLYNVAEERRAGLRQVADDIHWKRMRASEAMSEHRRAVLADADHVAHTYEPLHFS